MQGKLYTPTIHAMHRAQHAHDSIGLDSNDKCSICMDMPVH